MNNERLLGAVKHFVHPRLTTSKAVFVICLGFCFILLSSRSSATGAQERNKTVARTAFLDYLNRKDFKNFEAIHTQDFVKHYNNSAPEDLAQEMEDAKGQFVSSSDLTFTINWMIAEGDKVAVCFTAKGTHDGVFRGIPPTGRKYEVSAMTVWRFVNGRIAEEWVFSNELDLYRQVGLFQDLGSSTH
jgi:steroid delta-isomerase-like uncharacterized protein